MYFPCRSQSNIGGIIGRAQGQICFGSCSVVYFPAVKRISRLCRIADRCCRSIGVCCRFRRKSCAVKPHIFNVICIRRPGGSQSNVVGIIGRAQGQICFGSCAAVYFPTVKCISRLCRVSDRCCRSIGVRCRLRRNSCALYPLISNVICICRPGGFKRNAGCIVGCP